MMIETVKSTAGNTSSTRVSIYTDTGTAAVNNAEDAHQIADALLAAWPRDAKAGGLTEACGFKPWHEGLKVEFPLVSEVPPPPKVRYAKKRNDNGEFRQLAGGRIETRANGSHWVDCGIQDWPSIRAYLGAIESPYPYDDIPECEAK